MCVIIVPLPNVFCVLCVCGAELAMSMCDYVYLIYIKFMCMDA